MFSGFNISIYNDLAPSSNVTINAMHQRNLEYRITFYIPIVFHNLKGFDSHFIIKEFACDGEGSIKVLRNSTEQYKAFFKTYRFYKDSEAGVNDENKEKIRLVSLKLIDSFQFISSALDKLVNNIPKEKMKITRRMFRNDLGKQQAGLLLRKGIFLYEYANGWERLDETSLPYKEEYFSSLTDENISKDDYKHAQKVWKTFNIRGEYLG